MARPKSEDKKQALLEAATAAFAQSGIAASTSAIARSAGVAEGTLFRYFATKDELLNELYLSIKSGLVKAMVSGLTPNEKRPKENARNIWDSYIDWSIRHPMEHKAIRRMALSERITDETRTRVREMFPELNEMCPAIGQAGLSQRRLQRLWRRPVSFAGGNHYRICQPRSAARPRADRPRF